MTFLVLLLALALEKFSGWRRRIQRDGAWLAWLSLVEDLPSVSRRSWLGLLLAVVLPLLPLALLLTWYALLGPVAALAYRLLALALEHARQPALREQAARVRHILDWLPVRALVLSFALVGNFLAVIRVLLHWLLAWDISAAALLGKAGRVASDVEAVELGAAGVASLDALWQLLVRAAVLWYAVFAFCALFL